MACARPKTVRGTPAVVVSLIVHGAVVAVAVRGGRVHAVGRTAAMPAVPPRPPALSQVSAEPIAVMIFDDAPARGGGGSGGRAHRAAATGAPGDARIAGARAAAADELRGRETGAGSPWMKMRGADLALGDDFVAEFARGGRPPEATPRSGRVDPAGGGRSVIRDRVTRISVDRDGTAHFHDKPDVDLHWDIHLPTPSEIIREARQAGRSVAEWYADPYKLARVGPAQDVPRHMLAGPGACDHWDDACSVELRQRDRPDDEDRGGDSAAHGKLALTDMLMRKFVGDPYASRKLKLLDDTRAERAEAGAAHTREDLARSAELMRRNLEALWRSTGDPAARRRALFALWDECTEGEGPAGEAGQRARLIVIGWIRAKLPAGSPDAFTVDEIAQLAAHGSSKQRFAPYE